MPKFLEFTYEKFIFRVMNDRYYSKEGLWFKVEGSRATVGLSDFVQQRSGDVAFVEIKPAGESFAAGDELILLETIKVDISFETPLSGKVSDVNKNVETGPEMINRDPYGEGWLAVVELSNWENERYQLMEPEDYFSRMKLQIEEEMK